jgi:hypothetical protein
MLIFFPVRLTLISNICHKIVLYYGDWPITENEIKYNNYIYFRKTAQLFLKYERFDAFRTTFIEISMGSRELFIIFAKMKRIEHIYGKI